MEAHSISMSVCVLDLPNKRFDCGRSICNQSLATSTLRILFGALQWTHSGHTVDTQWTHSGHNSGHTVDTAKHKISRDEIREPYLFEKAFAIPLY